GPPPTSGTRDAFVETAIEDGARRVPCLAQMERDAPNLFRARAHDLREDGHWIDSGENDNAMIRVLANNAGALGVFGYSFLDQNDDKVEGVPIGGVSPTVATIRDGSYPVVRELYLYIRADGAEEARAYAREFTSEEASGAGGYLEAIGLIPLADAERARMRERLTILGGQPS
ncbi:MAG: substrate-binding domain-containing protein, partial [Litorimonas sp.]